MEEFETQKGKLAEPSQDNDSNFVIPQEYYRSEDPEEITKDSHQIYDDL